LKERIHKPLAAYAATVLRVSKSGRDERRDLDTFRKALEEYFVAAELTMSLAKNGWDGAGKEDVALWRERAKVNAVTNAGPKLNAAMKAMDELLDTVTEVAKDMNEEGKATGASARGGHCWPARHWRSSWDCSSDIWSPDF